MPFKRKFYYLTPDNGSRDVVTPCESLWELEGTSLLSPLEETKGGVECRYHRSFQDLPKDTQMAQLRYKKILGILNKMTPRKFQKLVVEMSPEAMDESHVKMLAEVIFSKAVGDEMYIHLYSRLCEEIMSVLVSDCLQQFQQTLVALCEAGFNTLLQLTDKDMRCNDNRFLLKRRLMSKMRFTSELSCISCPLISRQHVWNMMERLIERGDELHLEAVYFSLFTISLLTDDNSWTETVDRIVGEVANGRGPKGEVTRQLRFLFMALADLKIGVLKKSFYSRWTKGTEGLDRVFRGGREKIGADEGQDAAASNLQLLIGLFPDSASDKSDTILELISHSIGVVDMGLWKVVRRLDLDLLVQLTFTVDKKSLAFFLSRELIIPYKTSTVTLKLLGTSSEEEKLLSKIPLPVTTDSLFSGIELTGSTCKETNFYVSESERTPFEPCDSYTSEDVWSDDEIDSTSRTPSINRSDDDEIMLQVLGKFGLTIKRERIKRTNKDEAHVRRGNVPTDTVSSCDVEKPNPCFVNSSRLHNFKSLFKSVGDKQNDIMKGKILDKDLISNDTLGKGLNHPSAREESRPVESVDDQCQVALLPSDYPLTRFPPDKLLSLKTYLVDKREEYKREDNWTQGICDLGFEYIFHMQGWLLVLCADRETADWLVSLTIENIAIVKSDGTPLISVTGYFPGIDWKCDTDIILAQISRHNRLVNDWTIKKMVASGQGSLLTFLISAKCGHRLLKVQNRVFFNGYTVHLLWTEKEDPPPKEAKSVSKRRHPAAPSCITSDQVLATTHNSSVPDPGCETLFHGFKYKVDQILYEKAETIYSGYKGPIGNQILFDAKFPGSVKYSTKSILKTLEQCNPKMNVSRWSCLTRFELKDGVVVLTLSSDSESLACLRKVNFKLIYNLETISLKTMFEKSWEEELSDVSSLSASESGVSPENPLPDVVDSSLSNDGTNKPTDESHVIFGGYFPRSCKLKNKVIHETLNSLNPGLNVDRWKIVGRDSMKRASYMRFSLDGDCLKALKEADFKVVFNSHKIYLRPFNSNREQAPNVSRQQSQVSDSAQPQQAVWSQSIDTSAQKHLSKSIFRFGGEIPRSSCLKDQEILNRLRVANPDLEVKRWQIVSRHNNVVDFSCDVDSLKLLKEASFKVTYGRGCVVQLEPTDSKKQQQGPTEKQEYSPLCSPNKGSDCDVKHSPPKSSDPQSNRALFQAIFPNTSDMKTKELFECIASCNAKLGVKKWKVINRQNVKGSSQMIFCSDLECIKKLKDYQYRICFQKHLILIKPLNRTWEQWERYLAGEAAEKSPLPLVSHQQPSGSEDRMFPHQPQPLFQRNVHYLPNMDGYKVAVLPANFPTTFLSDRQFALLETALGQCLSLEFACKSLPFTPRFKDIFRFGGWLLVICHDRQTAKWLVNLNIKPWENAQLNFVTQD